MVLSKRNRTGWAALALAALLGLGLLAAACGDDGGTADGSTPTPTSNVPTVVPGTPTPAVSPTPGAQRAPEIAAAEALALSFEAQPDEVEVVSVTPMDFSDACLGVGDPGEVCAEVVTPGFVVVLQFGSSQFSYHTTADGTVVRFAGIDVEDEEE